MEERQMQNMEMLVTAIASNYNPTDSSQNLESQKI